jgi:hypothetical protein
VYRFNNHLLLLLLLLLYIYTYNTSIPSNTTVSKDMGYSYMFRLTKSLSGRVKNREILQNGCAHLGSQMAYSFVLNYQLVILINVWLMLYRVSVYLEEQLVI